ncbi:MAG: hypothetical protein V1846_00705 [Candidatus Komeilibacteria bacterium]
MINKKTLPIFIVVLLVVAGASFYGGMLYGKSTTGPGGNFPNLTAEQRAAMGNGQFGANRAAGNGTGLASGDVLAKDDKSITLKLRDGGSKTILLSSSTETQKMATVSADEVTVGTAISVVGTTNSDGSISAKTIQIRPVGLTPPNATSTPLDNPK